MNKLLDNFLEKADMSQTMAKPGQELATQIAERVCNQLGMPEPDSFDLVFSIAAELLEKYKVREI